MSRYNAIRNWGKTFTFIPENIEKPKSTEAVVAIVNTANRYNQKIRPIGSRYSYTPLVSCEETTLSLQHFTGVEEINSNELTALVRAGTKLEQLEKVLFSKGFSLYNMGDINQQTLAGLISTGSHGTGLSFATASNQITWLELVTPDGTILECSESQNKELFKAAQVSLGVLGVITRMKIRILPKYCLRQERTLVDFNEALNQLHHSFCTNRNYEFFWFPYTNFVFEKKGNITDLPSTTNLLKKNFNDYFLENGMLWLLCEGSRYLPNLYRKNANWFLQKMNTNLNQTMESIHYYATPRYVNHREIEYALPLTQAIAALGEIKKMLNEHQGHVSFPIEVRCAAADDIYLSPGFDCESVWIAVHAYTRDEYQDFFRKAEQIFLHFGGRPHWGKLHWLSHNQLKERYPCWDKFMAIRKELDPKGIFLNKYLQELFEGSN